MIFCTNDIFITKVKNNIDNIGVIREINAKLGNEVIVKKLYNFVRSELSNRNGGYTRIVKICQRKSDGSSMAKIEFVDSIS